MRTITGTRTVGFIIDVSSLPALESKPPMGEYRSPGQKPEILIFFSIKKHRRFN